MRTNEGSTRAATRAKPTYVLLAGAILGLVVMPIAFAGAAKSPEATASASVKKQLKKLKKRVASLEGEQAPTTLSPNGPAGGDLTGTFPDPLIGPNAVGSAEIEDNAVGTAKIADDAVTSPKIAANVVGSSELKGTYAAVSAGASPAANTYADRTATCNAGDTVLGGGYAWQNNATTISTVFSTPDPLTNPNQWIVRSSSSAAGNTLFAWATCLAN